MFTANLTCFQDNPWQPRKTMRQERLEELAVKIYSLKATRPETLGLLQMPAARLVDGISPVPLSLVRHLIPVKGDLTRFLKEQKFSLQLAWGHRRRAAFGLLTKGLFIPPLEGDTTKVLVEQVIADADYQFFPFELVEFTDQEMFELAVTENGDRDDLTTIETAQAMVTYRDQFGRSSAEIGKLFGNMSGSAVRNMIRLLDLPDGPRQALAEGRMSQGAGRNLLSLYDLPETLRKQAEQHYINETKPSKIIEDATQNGAMASQIDTRIAKLLASFCEYLSAGTWKWEESFDGDNIHHPDCKTCDLHLTRGNKHYCADKSCFRAKTAQMENRKIAEASLASGIPVYQPTENTSYYYQPARFSSYQEDDSLKFARSIGCPNLCIRYDANFIQNGHNHNTLQAEGYPHAEFICSKRDQYCTCKKATQAGMDAADVVPQAPSPAPSATDDPKPSPAPAQISEKELKAINKAINAEKNAIRAEVKTLREKTKDQFYLALMGQSLKAWKKVASKLKYNCGQQSATMDDLIWAIAGQLIEEEFQFTDTDNLTSNQRRAAEFIRNHVEPAARVSTETPAVNTPSHIDATQDGPVL